MLFNFTRYRQEKTMRQTHFCRGSVVFLVVAMGAIGISMSGIENKARGEEENAVKASAKPDFPLTHPDEVKKRLFQWLDEVEADAGVKNQAEAIWAESKAGVQEDVLLDRFLRTAALADPRVEKLLALCSQPHRSPTIPPQEWLTDERTSPLIAANSRLYFGRWLVLQSMYDEAQGELDNLEPDQVVAPAMLLFYRGVTAQQLLDKEGGVKTLDRLIETMTDAPRRYITLAKIMRDDLSGLDEESLDHISRRMDDIRRRLDLGRAGPKVRKQEDGVIESIDKLIKKIEDKQKQQQQMAMGQNNLHPSQPAQDSRIMGGKGPGEVTKKEIGSKSDWGDLPPKQREEVMQQIGRDFPAHYRDVLEQYFKRLASEKTE